MTVHCVTGTDAEVGKTVVTAALAVVWRARGRSAAVVKPVQSGVGPGEPGDVDEVRRLAGPVDVREGVRLSERFAPDIAAAIEGVDLPSLCDQRDLVLGAVASHDLVLVEGSGGVAVHLGLAFTLLDIADMVRDAGERVSWLVVAPAGLGALNHAALTVQAIQQRRHDVSGLVIGSWPDNPGPAERYIRDDLARYTGVPVVGAVPEGAGRLPPETFRIEAPSWLPYLEMD